MYPGTTQTNLVQAKSELNNSILFGPTCIEITNYVPAVNIYSLTDKFLTSCKLLDGKDCYSGINPR